MRALQTNADKDVAYSSFVLTGTGLVPIGTPSFEEWEEVGHFLKKATTACALWLGDWINYGHAKFGEKYLLAIARTGLDYGTLRNASYTSRRIDLSDRSDKLGYKHNEIVASLPPILQRALLREAVQQRFPFQIIDLGSAALAGDAHIPEEAQGPAPLKRPKHITGMENREVRSPGKLGDCQEAILLDEGQAG